MAGVTTNVRYHSVPQPRLVKTDAALELNIMMTSEIVSYVGTPTMCGIVG